MTTTLKTQEIPWTVPAYSFRRSAIAEYTATGVIPQHQPAWTLPARDRLGYRTAEVITFEAAKAAILARRARLAEIQAMEG